MVVWSLFEVKRILTEISYQDIHDDDVHRGIRALSFWIIFRSSWITHDMKSYQILKSHKLIYFVRIS